MTVLPFVLLMVHGGVPASSRYMIVMENARLVRYIIVMENARLVWQEDRESRWAGQKQSPHLEFHRSLSCNKSAQSEIGYRAGRRIHQGSPSQPHASWPPTLCTPVRLS